MARGLESNKMNGNDCNDEENHSRRAKHNDESYDCIGACAIKRPRPIARAKPLTDNSVLLIKYAPGFLNADSNKTTCNMTAKPGDCKHDSANGVNHATGTSTGGDGMYGNIHGSGYANQIIATAIQLYPYKCKPRAIHMARRAGIKQNEW